MADLFQHTDEDGARLVVSSRADGDLLAVFTCDGPGPRGEVGVDLPEVDGRRLLATLQQHYARLDGVTLAGQSCPSRIAHESGVVLACTVEHSQWLPGLHVNAHHRVTWDDGDNRVLLETLPVTVDA